MISITAAADGDDVTIVWQPSDKLDGCLGFGLQRDVDGARRPEFLKTEMPFAGQTAAPGESHPSSVWPIQRFVWTDHLAPPSVRLRYRVCPVTGSADAPTLTPQSEWSDWTPWVSCSTGQTPGFSLYPNRGVVAAPWVERRLAADIATMPANRGKKQSAMLAEVIATPGDPLRDDLAGQVLEALRDQFAGAAAASEDIYAALYELRDDELVDLLIAAGDRAHVIVANGSFTPEKSDPNKKWADQLKHAGIDVTRRMVGSGHFADNKFLVFVDGSTAKRVWTGSTNWTNTGLCTQANHGLLIEDATIADGFHQYWQRMKTAGDDYPDDYITANDTPATSTAHGVTTQAWCVPVHDYADLDAARALIAGAEQGALFLMFKPGNAHTLVDDIKLLHDAGKFIRGVVNSGAFLDQTAPTIEFFNKSARATHGDPELILPDHLRDTVANEEKEVGVTGVLIHSKSEPAVAVPSDVATLAVTVAALGLDNVTGIAAVRVPLSPS